MSALVVAVVGDQQAGAATVVIQSFGTKRLGTSVAIVDLLCDLSNSIFFAGVKQLHKLRGLATRGGTHIKDGHARSSVDEERRDHANDLLATDVSNVCLGDEELLERREGCKSSNDVLGSGHGPCELIGVPRDWARWLDELVLVFDGGDFGDMMVLEALLDSESMSVNGYNGQYCFGLTLVRSRKIPILRL